MKYLLRILLFLLLIGSVFYNRAITESSNTVISSVREAFALPILTIRNLFRVNDFAKTLSSLELENQSLRAELAAVKFAIPFYDDKFMRARVHVFYPFNNKSVFTIAAGRSDGVKEGMAVLASPGVYVGVISLALDNWSEVRTIYDASIETPVRIGDNGVAALLRGGSGLTATMIDKAKKISVGDEIYLAQKGFPYGLKIGDIVAMRDQSVFKEADVVTPYALTDLSEVLIYAK